MVPKIDEFGKPKLYKAYYFTISPVEGVLYYVSYKLGSYIIDHINCFQY